MQAIVQKVAMQAALIGSISAGSYVLRKFKNVKHNEFLENTVYLKENIELCQTLNGIYMLKNDNLFMRIVSTLEEILKSVKEKKNEWTINRKITHVIEISNLMKQNAIKTLNEELITHAIDYENEYYPNLKSHLDNILHNMLLDRNES